MKIVVFVSGRGSNLRAILDSRELKGKIEVKAVFSDRGNCKAFRIAENNSINTYTLGENPGQTGYKNLSHVLNQLNIELIVLAGFLKLIPDEIVKKYKNKIINLHPALLPSFSGKGMYGIHVHEAVFNSSVKVSGATVHFVDSTYDTGKIIVQKCVDISDVNSPEEIAQRVLKVEHQLLPFVIGKFADKKIEVINDRVVILE